MNKALIVEDDADLRNMVALAARCCGLEPISAATLADAISLLQGGPCAAVLTDLQLPDSGGTHTLRALRAADGDAILVAVTGSGLATQKLRQCGAEAVIRKPFTLDELRAELVRVLDAHPGRTASRIGDSPRAE